MELSRQWIRETWATLLAGADVTEASTVLYIVSGEHNINNVETAYFPPNGQELCYEVLRRVGEERLHEDNGLHRFAIFQTVRAAPLGGMAAMLRHELRHAEQFHDCGPGLFELDGHLRAALDVHTRAAERERYRAIPLEYDANRVAAQHAHEHHVDELEAMAADERFAAYVCDDYDDRAADLLAATLVAVNEHVDPSEVWNGEPISADVAYQHELAREYTARNRAFDQYNPTRGERPGVIFL